MEIGEAGACRAAAAARACARCFGVPHSARLPWPCRWCPRQTPRFSPRGLAQVALMELPEGVPEQQPVVCGSKSGAFLTRTQRILFEGEELSASRFEQARPHPQPPPPGRSGVSPGCHTAALSVAARCIGLVDPVAQEDGCEHGFALVVGDMLVHVPASGTRGGFPPNTPASGTGTFRLRTTQVSGKGDAKKWKSSVSADLPDGPMVRARPRRAARVCDHPLLTHAPSSEARACGLAASVIAPATEAASPQRGRLTPGTSQQVWMRQVAQLGWNLAVLGWRCGPGHDGVAGEAGAGPQGAGRAAGQRHRPPAVSGASLCAFALCRHHPNSSLDLRESAFSCSCCGCNMLRFVHVQRSTTPRTPASAMTDAGCLADELARSAATKRTHTTRHPNF